MATKSTPTTDLPLAREIGAQLKLAAHKKSELRIGWEGASRPQVLETLTAYDEKAVDQTADALMARFS